MFQAVKRYGTKFSKIIFIHLVSAPNSGGKLRHFPSPGYPRQRPGLTFEMYGHFIMCADTALKLGEGHKFRPKAPENKKLSWCWQTRATRLEVSQGHQTQYHSICQVQCPINIIIWNINFVFFPIGLFDFKKCRNLEIRVRGHSRSWKMVPFDRLGMVSY